MEPPRNYVIEKSPHIAGEGNRGVAVLLHRAVPYTRLNINTTLEAVAVKIDQKRSYTICSLYMSPNLSIRKEDIIDLFKQLPAPFLLLGDFNGKHPLWDKINPPDQRGKMLEKLFLEESLGLYNDEAPTHFHVQTGSLSTIDLSVCSLNAMSDFVWRIDDDLHSSDHYPIYLTSKVYAPKQDIPRWLFKRANWELFSSLTESISDLPVTEPTIYMESILDKIKEAAEESIPKSDGYYRTCPVPWWNKRCEMIKRERNKAEKRLLRNPTAANKMEYKRLRGVTKRIFKDAKATSWKSYVSSLNDSADTSSVWKKVNKIKGKFNPRPASSLKINDVSINSPEEVAKVFADHFSMTCRASAMREQNSYKKSLAKLKRISYSKGAGHQDNTHLNAPFTLEELKQQLTLCKDTSPGPDTITTAMIKHMSDASLSTLLSSFNMLWEAHQYPDCWRREIKLPIGKPNKDTNDVRSYRPISLTSCVCKLFERMVNTRLVWFLEKNNLLSPYQSGFRKHRSTMDAVAQLTSHVEKAFQTSKHTIAVFFDLEKAYDTVWRAEILHSLYEMGLRGNLPYFIQNFLTERKFCVRVGPSQSDLTDQMEGIPQGSVLSVTCFAIAINDIANTLSRDVHCTLYVDDFTIFVSAKKEHTSERLLQNTINKLEKWAKERGMKFSQEKTVVMKFNKRKGSDPILKIYGEQIRVVESTRFLGLIIDSRLSWKQHVEFLRQSTVAATNLIKHLSHLSWGADRKTLLRLYGALVRSKLDYGCQFYSSANEGLLTRLNPIQNQCLRACTGAFKSSPIVSLCVESGVMPLSYARDIVTLKYLFKTQSLPNTPTFRALHTEDTPNEVNPARERMHSLINKYHIETPRIWINSIPEEPPWLFPDIQVCPFLMINKSSTPIEEIKSAFLSHKDEHDSIHIYTDGSKKEDGVGYASVLPTYNIAGGLPDEASIFTAELYAIKATVEYLIENEEESTNYTIFCDSQSVLQTLKSKTNKSFIVVTLQQLLFHASNKNININLCWVPGHCGIAGNDKADIQAKSASSSVDALRQLRAIPHTDMTGIIKATAKGEWQREWSSAKYQDKQLREVKPEIKYWSSSCNKNRRVETALTRLRIGHTNLTHSYLMVRGIDPPVCDRCSVQVTVKHILIECEKFTAARRKYYNNPSLSTMLRETDEFSLNRLISYLQEIGILNNI